MKYISLSSITPIVREDYAKSILFNTNELPAGGHLLQVVSIPPKTKQRAHYHNIQTEIFYILDGECSIFINEQEFIAKPDDAFVCAPKDVHYLWNKSEKAFKLVVFKVNKPAEDEDSVWQNT